MDTRRTKGPPRLIQQRKQGDSFLSPVEPYADVVTETNYQEIVDL